MIKRLNERENGVKEKLKDGIGYVDFKTIAGGEEVFNKIKMFSTLTIKPGNSIGYHTHVGEQEVMLINKGSGLYKDDGNESIVNPGDVTVCFENHYHGITNNTNEDLELIAMVIEKNA